MIPRNTSALILFTLIFTPAMAQVDSSVYQPSESYRPKIHFSPQQGWMSDPNGLVYYDGEYHLFYQHVVKGGAAGPHWGHAVSEDLLRWKHLPIALYPDSMGYIYSGSCVVDLKNTSGLGSAEKPPMLAFFTYHNPKAKPAESQALAYSLDRGRTWTKYAHNPVLKNPGLPDFRDPKVMWNESAKNWLMSLAAGEVIQFYSSPDGINWTLVSDFGKGKGNHIGPWECPDFFPVKVAGTNETKWVLLVSVVDLTQTVDRLKTATQYFIGDFDGKTFKSSQQDTRWIDYGRDNYAGVTFSNAPENRRIFLGWMQSHQYGGNVEQRITKTWAGAATFPREIGIVKNGSEYVLTFQPVKELAKLYKKSVALKKTKIDGQFLLSNAPPFDKAPMELELTFSAERLPGKYGIRLKNAANEQMTFYYDKKANHFFVDRRNAIRTKFHERYGSLDSAAYKVEKKVMTWRLLVDVASVELFAEEGKIVFSDTFYPTKPFDQIEIFTENGGVVLEKGLIRALKSIR